ncbi:uncharacterized protein Z518_06043 [Rhinocladiella mackenziei CBS 650.93]|uniref:NAD(P)-binding protein n=1 Tax=Rhinocladiella mackenziei CBS 650.93 TaxID=1442369 RepID=A0A0D2IPR7_9EURO|nr:uncharacterized protein Z518_06043 [Rhinocladiella mackenziei CBS 650.93]KIX05171.1 hypothetical protein Z518_06043 [Rhinocladiella mackenziei CBS 650.93]
MENLPEDFWATSGAYTPHIYRDQYPSIDPTTASLSQAGKVIIITGASSGIGARGFAPAFAKAGAKALVLVARNQTKLKETASTIQAINPAVETSVFAADVSEESEVAKLYEVVKARYGHADVLINNAGAFNQESPIIAANPSKWWADFEVNVKGVFLMAKYFLDLLGKGREGTVITMNTGLATVVVPGQSAYSISKMASLRITEFLAAENPNVSAVSLQPGVVKTDMVTESFQRFAQDTPELVGGTGVWLATDSARFLSGRFVSANWSVDDLKMQMNELVSGNDLKMVLHGKFGLDPTRPQGE